MEPAVAARRWATSAGFGLSDFGSRLVLLRFRDRSPINRPVYQRDQTKGEFWSRHVTVLTAPLLLSVYSNTWCLTVLLCRRGCYTEALVNSYSFIHASSMAESTAYYPTRLTLRQVIPFSHLRPWFSQHLMYYRRTDFWLKVLPVDCTTIHALFV